MEEKKHGGARKGTGPKPIEGGRSTVSVHISNNELNAFLLANPERGALSKFVEECLKWENKVGEDTNLGQNRVGGDSLDEQKKQLEEFCAAHPEMYTFIGRNNALRKEWDKDNQDKKLTKKNIK